MVGALWSQLLTEAMLEKLITQSAVDVISFLPAGMVNNHVDWNSKFLSVSYHYANDVTALIVHQGQC